MAKRRMFGFGTERRSIIILIVVLLIAIMIPIVIFFLMNSKKPLSTPDVSVQEPELESTPARAPAGVVSSKCAIGNIVTKIGGSKNDLNGSCYYKYLGDNNFVLGEQESCKVINKNNPMVGTVFTCTNGDLVMSLPPA
jgi:hypothetical protein